ncbi:23S rRNA (uracil(1939)-C(5))-methyltransferase RlmD [Clostridiales bacterium COT073_COT-073]|nr:23S rRNA (uracil(1939)-C(5))-methyltransferase RlmD [Clostridiales bacterium COT073_COT-073]
MKKGEEFIGKVIDVDFPNKAMVQVGEEIVIVKNAIIGQTVRGRIQKKKRGIPEGVQLEVLEHSLKEREALCPVFGVCGGCNYQILPYQEQLAQKLSQVKKLLKPVGVADLLTEIAASPSEVHYRNKMEYSFGNECIDGQLTLGLHKRGSSYDIVPTGKCIIVPEDFNRIVCFTEKFFREKGSSFYHLRRQQGFLRYLVLRHGQAENELMINLVTTSQTERNKTDKPSQIKEKPELFNEADSQYAVVYEWKEALLALLPSLDNEVVSILHTISDTLSDAVKPDQICLLYGRDYYKEKLFDLQFKVSPFSFFQTNTKGAEKLYQVVADWIGETKDKVIFDLYSGTGTIAQIVSKVAKKAVGVEIVEEAVESAKENARLNGLNNCEFIAGDVLKVVDELTDKPDILVLDPPRDGIHPKALPKIIGFGVEKIIYVSCKPSSLARDLPVFMENGYKVDKIKCVDMFPQTHHVECIALIQRVKL